MLCFFCRKKKEKKMAVIIQFCSLCFLIRLLLKAGRATNFPMSAGEVAWVEALSMEEISDAFRAEAWRKSSLGYAGVRWHKRMQKWCAEIHIPCSRAIWLGTFADETEAARACDAAAYFLWGRCAEERHAFMQVPLSGVFRYFPAPEILCIASDAASCPNTSQRSLCL